MQQHSIGRPLSPAVVAAVSTALLASFSVQAIAQQASTPESADAEPGAMAEVQITGSRIMRRDLEAASPIVTVADESFTESSTIAVESVLNQMPQFVPAASQFTASDIFPSATNTPGISTINLRGLGSNRTLVLIDGRRGQPANSTLVIDTNSIPSSALESVEIISGGASAAYGADAMGGVTNFKLKSDFQGASIDVHTGVTEEGDGQETRFSTLLGANVGEGRGNAMLGLEYTERELVLQRDREFYSRAFTDPSTSALAVIRLNFNKYQPFAGNLPSQAAANAALPNRPSGTTVSRTTPFYFNTGSNTLFKDTGGLGFEGPLGDGRYRMLPSGVLGENNLDGVASSPLQRYSVFGKADFKINDRISTFAQLNFVKTTVESTNQPIGVDGVAFVNLMPYGNDLYGPSIDAMGNTLPDYRAGGLYGLNCPAVGGCTKSQAFPVPTQLAALLNSRGPNQYTTPSSPMPIYDPLTGLPVAQVGMDANYTLGGTLDFIPGRVLENVTQLYQVLTGLQGTVGISDWTWEAYVSHGETETDNNYLNYASLERYQAVLTSPNYGRNFSTLGQGSTSATCTSGLPIFEEFEISDDCIAAFTAVTTDRTQLTQDVIEANLQGKVIDLPAGELRGALGLSYRKNEFEYMPDAMREVNSFVDIPISTFGQANVFGETEVKEAYTEVLVPLLRDRPWARSLELELGFRYSDYDISGGVPTYKGLFSWAPNDYIRLRGGYQVANRAPNINELFLGESANPVTLRSPNPCRADTREANGNLATNPDRAQVQALCSQIIGPTFDVDPDNYLGDGRAYAGEIELRSGNRNLRSEEGKTYTLGMILSSPFEHPAARGLTLALDYYRVNIEDAIGVLDAQTTYDLCFNRDRQSNPTYSLDDPNGLCRNIALDPSSEARLFVDVAYENLGILKTSGIDAQLNWRAALQDIGLSRAPGALSVSVSYNKLLKFDSQDFATQPVQSSKGTLANGGQFSYRAVTNVRYTVGSASVGLNWRHLPAIRSTAYVTDPATLTGGAKAYDIFNLSGSMGFGENIRFTAGIDNLFDREPNIVGAGQVVTVQGGGTAVLSGVGNTNSGFYDILGRRYYASVRFTF